MKKKAGQQTETCLLCGDTRLETLPLSVSRIPNVRCDGCGLVFQPSIHPAERLTYYRSSGYHKRSINRSARRSLISRSMLWSSAENKLRALGKRFGLFGAKLRVLDVGCGYGALLAVLRDTRQCDVKGIEPSPQACAVAKDWFDLDLIENTLEEACLETCFDLVLVIHCLEHSDHPVGFLKQCGRMLSPSGKLYVETPNIYRPTAGFSWPRFLERDHLFQFTAVTLRMTAAQAGLRITDMDERGHLRTVMVRNGRNSAPSRREQIENAKTVADFIPAYAKLRWIRMYPFRRLAFLLCYLVKIIVCKCRDILF